LRQDQQFLISNKIAYNFTKLLNQQRI